ncbi:DUF3515 domain-containing protein [Paenibacillus sp. TRM 82003]|uniref:DUF3515 family protein n=1 Tax=Kineococcus sp. TRM81007 TaxID=2925831 RepID=UPI001F573E90|nr:DUF3515 family protein [Kineococcus sp. TRM81007]MCI2240202.1 DUF3515 domain-containing protein [Kineococcus sp. TRM81007]MCI3927620.1 DUF3515 domain-containing protein [Paenibacillus sp. TRM 82003]
MPAAEPTPPPPTAAAPRSPSAGRQGAWVAVVVALVVGASVWAFTSGSDGVEAAPAAGDPACARLLQELPGSLVGLARTPQGAAGVAVWGEEQVVLRCGAAVIGPTTKPCVPVGPDDASTVDWVQDAVGDRAVRFLTYGRDPAVEVTVRFGGRLQASSASAPLVDLAAAVSAIPQTRACV